MGIHDGHRQRLRSSFIENGLQSFSELTALELLLFFAVPRIDTNIIAHRLLNKFGNLYGVFNAGFHELLEVEGVGEAAAALIRLVPQIMRKGYISAVSDMKKINNSDDAGKYLLPRFLYEQDEIFLMLCLDSQNRVISCLEISRGVVNAVETTVRKIAEAALKCRASSVIIAHNHPDGSLQPSREDEATTRQIFLSLECIGIKLLDHIIVADEEYLSFANKGIMPASIDIVM